MARAGAGFQQLWAAASLKPMKVSAWNARLNGRSRDVSPICS